MKRYGDLGLTIGYLLLGGIFVFLCLLICGCQTNKPVDPKDLEFPPVKYSTPPLPQWQARFDWLQEDLPEAIPVALAWNYTDSRSNILFRVYESERPYCDTNHTGWRFVGETANLSWTTQPPVAVAFWTVTASNTRTMLESTPAVR